MNLKRILLALCIGYGLYVAILSWDRRADGFTVEKIHSDLTYNSEWDVKVSPEAKHAANTVLSQTFHYLDRGFQCYAFVSADGNYVLKFMRHQRLRAPFYYDFLPDFAFKKFKREKALERTERRDDLFMSLKTAYETIPEETGLVFLHLNKTSGQHPTISIFDATGKKYEVKLDDVEFVLQKKAVLIKPTITALMKEGKVSEAEARIDQIFTLLADCAKKGMQDLDGALIYKDNLGFLPERAIYIDTGKLVKNKVNFAKDVKRLRPLRKWLLQNYPELASYFDKAKEQAIKNYDSN